MWGLAAARVAESQPWIQILTQLRAIVSHTPNYRYDPSDTKENKGSREKRPLDQCDSLSRQGTTTPNLDPSRQTSIRVATDLLIAFRPTDTHDPPFSQLGSSGCCQRLSTIQRDRYSRPPRLRAVLSTGLAQYFRTEDLSRALRASNCSNCDSFGAFLFLPDCRRCRWLCLTSARTFRPKDTLQARILSGLSSKEVDELPQPLGNSGSYGILTGRKQNPIISAELAKKAGLSLHGSWEAMSVCLHQKHREIPLARPIRDRHFMAATRFPTLDRASKSLDWGVYWNGCQARCARLHKGLATASDDEDDDNKNPEQWKLIHTNQDS